MTYESIISPKIDKVTISHTPDFKGSLSDLRTECNYLDRDCQSLGMRLGIYTGVHTRNRHEWEQKSDDDVIKHLQLCLAGERPHAEQSMLELAKEIATESQFEIQPNELEIIARTGINIPTVLFIATLLGYDKNIGFSEVRIEYQNCSNGRLYLLRIKINPSDRQYDYMLEFDLKFDECVEYKESFIYLSGIPHSVTDTIGSRPLTDIVGGPIFDALGIVIINSSIDDKDVTKLTLDHNRPLISLKDHLASGGSHDS